MPLAERSCPPRLARRRETVSHFRARDARRSVPGPWVPILKTESWVADIGRDRPGSLPLTIPNGQWCPIHVPFEAACAGHREVKRSSLLRPPGAIDGERRRAWPRSRELRTERHWRDGSETESDESVGAPHCGEPAPKLARSATRARHDGGRQAWAKRAPSGGRGARVSTARHARAERSDSLRRSRGDAMSVTRHLGKVERDDRAVTNDVRGR